MREQNLQRADRLYRALLELKDEAMIRDDRDLRIAVAHARGAFEASAPAGWSPTDIGVLPLRYSSARPGDGSDEED